MCRGASLEEVASPSTVAGTSSGTAGVGRGGLKGPNMARGG